MLELPYFICHDPYSICHDLYIYGRGLGTHQSVVKKILNTLVLDYEGLISTNYSITKDWWFWSCFALRIACVWYMFGFPC
jgi:hypothetical protein